MRDEEFTLSEVFMIEHSATRGPLISDSRAVVRVSLAISDVDVVDEDVAQVGTKFEVAIRGHGDEEPYCNVLSEYVVRFGLPARIAPSTEARDRMSRAAMKETFARHRDRVMESTMRMGVPLPRLPLTLEEVEEKAESGDSGGDAA